MQITALMASPRPQGNSTALAQGFLDQAAQLGAEIKTYRLNQMNFQGCQGCFVCKTKLDHCVLKDELTPALADLAAADIWVVAAPVYFGQVPGQLKLALDRWFSFLTPDYRTAEVPTRLAHGKQSVWVMSQGAPAERFAEVATHFEPFLGRLGFKAQHLLRYPDSGPGRREGVDPQALDEARALARQVMA